MSTASTAQPAAQRLAPVLTRATFVALLALVAAVPHVWVALSFPAVFDAWSLLPFCGLVLVVLVDLRRPAQLAHLDLLALLSLVVAIAYAGASRPWSMLLLYPQLFFLAARMLHSARAGSRPLAGLRAQLPAPWLAGGLLVLLAVHVVWAASHGVLMDVAAFSVTGAQRVIHGRALYAGPAGQATYGPANFLAYVPFAAIFDNVNTAARSATVLFTTLTAALLFALGRRARGADTGLLLAFCWLALPFTLYEDATAFNDSLVAAALVGTLLVAEHPARRGAMAALAGWTKLVPLALVPLLALRRGGARLPRFAVGFVLATTLVFVPALAHSTPGSFISQTFGYQVSRADENTLWAALAGPWARHAHWLASVSAVAHALILGSAVAVALLLPRARLREDLAGLAAACAGVLLLFQLSLNDYAYSYILWFAAPMLIALVLGGEPASAPAPRQRVRTRTGRARPGVPSPT